MDALSDTGTGEPVVGGDETEIGFILDAEDGLLLEQVMTMDVYKEWMENQLAKSQEGIDRQFLEGFLEYFDNGHTITLYLYEDGSFTIQRN